MTAFTIPFGYVTIICHQTVNEAIQIIPIVHETMYEKFIDESTQVDVSIFNSVIFSLINWCGQTTNEEYLFIV